MPLTPHPPLSLSLFPLVGRPCAEHLTQVLLKLIVERPDDANTAFETISSELRKLPPPLSEEEKARIAAEEAAAAAEAARLAEEAAAAAAAAAEEAKGENGEDGEPVKKKKTKLPVGPVGPLTPEQEAAAKLEAWTASHACYMLPPPPKPEPAEGEEEEEEAAAEPEEEPDPMVAGPVDPLLDDAALWSAAGVGFGEVPTYRLFRALQLLSGRETPDGKVRFWGKVLGRSADYYVAEAPTEQTAAPDPLEADEAEEKPGFQLPGLKDYDAEGLEGPNKYTYWVTTDPAGPRGGWTKLPHVTPAQVAVARAHRRFFTGDLAAPARTFPPLPGGTEAHLLRAAIADITAETVLTLAGVGVEADDDALAEEPPQFKTKPVEDDEENPKVFEVAELKLQEAWVHAEVGLRPSGRCQVKPPPEEEEGEAPDLEAKRLAFFAAFGAKDGPADADPAQSGRVCASIAEDSLGPGRAAWVVRAVPGPAAAGPAAFAFAKSLKWPGAVAVAAGFHAPAGPHEKPRRRFTNVYCGYGVPKAAATTTFAGPAPVGAEQAPPPDEEADVVEEPPKEAEEDE